MAKTVGFITETPGQLVADPIYGLSRELRSNRKVWARDPVPGGINAFEICATYDFRSF
jgi:hypothetical protein